MTTQLLRIDASARPGRAGTDPHGSRSRALTNHFVRRWVAMEAGTVVMERDVGQIPPPLLDAAWIRAAFTGETERDPSLAATLATSDALVAELQAADLVVIGMPMYNFGMPASLKAWVDQVVRIGVTFGFDPERDDPYLPLLADRPRRAVILTSRGGHGFDDGGAMAGMNHADTHLRTVLGFLGISDVVVIAIEHEEDGGGLLQASTDAALAAIDHLVERWTAPRMAA